MPLALTTGESVAVAALITVALAMLHVAAPALRRLRGVPERVTASFAGGIAVSYVFVHLLPELAEGNEAVGEALEDVVEPTALLDLAIFVVALAGFVAFYGLERLARGARRRANDEPPVAVFRLHLGSFLAYNALITYTMPLRVQTGLAFALLFTAAMGLHFVLTDRGLQEHYPRRFRHVGRYALAGALLGGWALGALLAPTSTVVVSLLTALLGGSILLNVFKEELPPERDSSFGWFVVGAGLYAALLAVTTAAQG